MAAGHASNRWVAIVSRNTRRSHLSSVPLEAPSPDDRDGTATPGASGQPDHVEASDVLDRLATWLAEVSAEVSLAGNGSG